VRLVLFLVFQLGSDRYAIDAAQVVEVLPLVNWKCVPRAPAGVAGIIEYRGVPIPLVDLTDLAIGRPSQKWMSTRIIVVNYRPDLSTRDYLLALVAEQAIRTVRRSEEEFVHSGLTVADSPYLGFVAADPAGAIQRIDVQHLLSETLRKQLFQEQECAL
jgi:chemotaxis-related protein WspB